MRYLVLLWLVALLPLASLAQVERGDTIFVRAFNFEDYATTGYKGWVKFPTADVRIEKALMLYRLKCPENRSQCGEWDYLAPIYLFDHTGKIDSVAKKAPYFTVNGETPERFAYRSDTTYTYRYNSDTKKTDTVRNAPRTVVLYADEKDFLLPTLSP